MSSDIVKDYFEMLELDVRDAWTFFRLLDQDGGSAIDLDEFLWGCMHLRGNATKLHLSIFCFLLGVGLIHEGK